MQQPANANDHGARPIDADLIALGHQLDPIIAEWSRLLASEQAQAAAFNAIVFEKTGIPKAPESTDEQPAYWEVRRNLALSDEARAATKDIGTVVRRIDRNGMPLALSIASLPPARSLAGLAVKARAATFCNPELWQEGDGYQTQLALLIENVWTLASVQPIGAMITARLRRASDAHPQ
jgi:hypothetical protein